jgi:NADH-quinone oxidoreductase subunit F
MKHSTQKTIARLLGALSAIVVVAAAGLLIAGHIDALRIAPLDKERVERLQQATNEDTANIPALEEELDRQTQASLKRSARTDKITNVLIVASILLLVGAKWRNRLDGRRLPSLSAIIAQDPVRSKLVRQAGQEPPQTQSAKEPCAECQCAPPAIDLAEVTKTVTELGKGKAAVIPILQAIQARDGYLHDDALKRVCELTDITPAQVISVSSFYRKFRRAPAGKHLLRVCHGTACHVAGAPVITDEIRRALGIEEGADTDPQRLFTVEEVACMGCCTLAPVAQIDEVTCGHLTPVMVPGMLTEFLSTDGNGAAGREAAPLSEEARAELPQGEIRIGLGSCCVAGGSGKVHAALQEAVAATGARVAIKRVGCVGMCHQTPLVEAVLPGEEPALYAGVGPEDAKSIVRRHFRAGSVGKRVSNAASSLVENILRNGQKAPVVSRAIEVRDPPVAAFLGRQKHIVTELCGQIDPTDLDEYLRRGGFEALKTCVQELTPRQVIDRIQRSGLRGRGGAGYLTGLKWLKVHEAAGDEKYIICNGDEGDPGAFMDRMLMESFPYRIIEGMAIAAAAVGARTGYFYVRAEYQLAVQRLRDALGECEERGLLGDDILGCGIKLQLKIMEGAGAFVCGEETALLASIEGNRGSPRLRPPFPAENGLWGKPTLVNNVETYATVPWIIREGPEAFAALGTPASKGTKVFALAGKVNRGGLIEVPMGVTIRQIVEEIGGGIKEGRRFKAVQIGGPSGGCIPESLADTPVDYEALTEVGAIMGSGGLVVLDESDCMVDIARYFLAFTQDQSCGKCTFCRVGTRRMLDILERLCAGEGSAGELETLEQLAYAVKSGSLCGLGKTAPNPVLSTLRYFRDEYEAHLEGRCPAGKCKALITYRVTDKCIGCTLCAQHCPADAIPFTPYEMHEIDNDKCTRCGICRDKCPEEAIEVT